ncbi:MAG TPA: MBL fold metallo-hydrolase [Smithellaceae bacterium]|jgi:phosphoribosyl 1,2-cyclic phosphodiesterase|nr:MBL fold metallo-hydrolase [Smithellaceae bacterium]HQF84372.1 MBL fold metallo-hydrolase [Smithellaceae bacterium]HQG80649.1 MBL fold metallo-hydrolase [Smithellaceae bacterium]
MIIRCWGARGSIPVCGKDYLRYGGNTTCLEIQNNNGDILLVDAGSGIREAGNALVATGRLNVTLLLTHGHWDHIMGFPFFKPLYQPQVEITVVGEAFAQDSIKDILAQIMSAPYFPINYDEVRANVIYADRCGDIFPLGDLSVESIALSHPNRASGYKFTQSGKTFVFFTDNELGLDHEGAAGYDSYVSFCRDADLLVHDAEYKDDEYSGKRGWGHSTVGQVAKLALDAGVKRLGLFHHNQDRRDDEIDDMVAGCCALMARAGAKTDCFGVSQGMEMSL